MFVLSVTLLNGLLRSRMRCYCLAIFQIKCYICCPCALIFAQVPIEEGVDPEDTYNETPYEKGFAFVSYLRSVVGSDDRFDKFLEAYATHYAQQSIQYQDFFAFFSYYFSDLKHIERRGDGLDFESWMHQPGLPPFFPDISAGETVRVLPLAARYWRSELTCFQHLHPSPCSFSLLYTGTQWLSCLWFMFTPISLSHACTNAALS